MFFVRRPPAATRRPGLRRRSFTSAALVRVALALLAWPAASSAQRATVDTAAPAAGSARPSVGADSTAAAARRAAAVAIAVGDRIRVRVWREPTLGDTVTVDERGEVVLPRLGSVHVEGRTIASLQDTLRARFSEYLRNPSVEVTVLRRVSVQGEVRAPNVYYVDATETAREVLAQAGGITAIGDPDNIVISRDGRTIPLGRWRDGGSLSADLRSGDQLIVGRTSWLSRNALAVVSTVGLIVTVAIQVINARRTN